MNKEKYKSTYVCDETYFTHNSSQKYQKCYPIGTNYAPIVTQIIVKIERNIEKSLIFESMSFLY